MCFGELLNIARFEVCSKQVEFCWVVTLCSVLVGYQRFGGPGCHFHNTTRRNNPEDLDLRQS